MVRASRSYRDHPAETGKSGGRCAAFPDGVAFNVAAPQDLTPHIPMTPLSVRQIALGDLARELAVTHPLQ